MPTMVQSEGSTSTPQLSALRVGRWIALVLTILTVLAFGLGITTPPRSGPFCTGQCITYPYIDAAQFAPRDYLWMFPGVLLTPLFVMLCGCIHVRVRRENERSASLRCALLQFRRESSLSTTPFNSRLPHQAVVKGETSGLALFTQYNPHGFFIALEDLGYLMMALAFLFIGAAFGRATRLERAIARTFISAGTLGFASFIGMSWHFAFNLDYRFEIAIITIVWTTLIVSGVLLSCFFWRPSRSDLAGS